MPVIPPESCAILTVSTSVVHYDHRENIMQSMQRRNARPELAAREKLLTDPSLGAGNFLSRAHTISPAPDEEFLFTQKPSEDAHEYTAVAYSMNSLTETIRHCAAWYYAQGITPGDPVGVYVHEGIDNFLQYLALVSLGAIPVLVNGRMPPAIAAEYFEFVGVVGIVGAEPKLAALAKARSLPLRFRVTPAEVERARVTDLPVNYPHDHEPDQLVMLCHSSGTTGRPKAVMFGHHQFFLGKRQRLTSFATDPSDRMLTALPQSHSAGISYLMTSVLLGLPTLVMADLSVETVASALTEFDPTIVVAFPHVYADLAEHGLSSGGAPHVHTWFNTGDSAHEAHVRKLVQLGHRPDENLPGSRFVDGLGASELGMALFQRISTPETTSYGRCIGQPIEVVEEAAVLDPEGQPLPPQQAGLLGVKSPTITPGYWNDTLRTVKSRLRGYWLTGDVVYRDEQGMFFHLDRQQDVIASAEGPVYSLPMEEILLLHQHIADCAVVGVGNGMNSTQRPIGVAVLSPGSSVDRTVLLGEVNRELAAAGHATLADLRIARSSAEFPVGPTGKVLKRQLRESLGGTTHGS